MVIRPAPAVGWAERRGAGRPRPTCRPAPARGRRSGRRPTRRRAGRWDRCSRTADLLQRRPRARRACRRSAVGGRRRRAPRTSRWAACSSRNGPRSARAAGTPSRRRPPSPARSVSSADHVRRPAPRRGRRCADTPGPASLPSRPASHPGHAARPARAAPTAVRRVAAARGSEGRGRARRRPYRRVPGAAAGRVSTGAAAAIVDARQQHKEVAHP